MAEWLTEIKKRERDEVVKKLLFGNLFFYQKIFRKNGVLYGIEILTRGNVNPTNQTDYTIFLEGIEFLFEIGAFSRFNERNLKIHFNLFPTTIPLIGWEFVSQISQGVLVVEVLERNIEQYLSYVDYLKDKGIQVALDDFGKGDSNFAVLDKFDILKVDCEVVKNCFWFTDYMKKAYPDKLIILEKANGIVQNPKLWQDCKADAYQCFYLHKPEPLTGDVLKRMLKELKN